MLVKIVIEGTLRNQVIEREIPEASLVSQLMFINEHGLFESERWIPSSRIKEVRFDQCAAKKASRLFFEPHNVNDRMIEGEEAK